MNICLPTTISTITASSEHATYPDDHLLLPRPRVVWQAASGAVTSATLTFALTGPVDTVVLLGAVAATAALEVWTGSAWATPAGLEEADYADTYQTTTGWWWHFATLTGSVQLRITLTQAGSAVIRAAILVAGSQVVVPGVQYPVAEVPVDTGFTATLLDGSPYYKERTIYRLVTATVRAERATAARALLRDVYHAHGRRPLAVQVVPGWGDDWLLYASLSPPQAAHGLPLYSQASFELAEVV